MAALNFLSAFQLVLQGALAVENTLAHTQPHETKKQLVVDAVDSVAKSLEQVPIPQIAGYAAIADVGIETFSVLYDAITASLRAQGVIKSPGPAAAPPPNSVPLASTADAPAADSHATKPIPIKV